MDYAHANFQSFPLSHHKFTRLRSQYCSVNSMDLTWAFFLPSALSFYSTVSASWGNIGTLDISECKTNQFSSNFDTMLQLD